MSKWLSIPLVNRLPKHTKCINKMYDFSERNENSTNVYITTSYDHISYNQ